MDDNIEIVIKISEKEYNGIKEDNSGMFGGHIYQAIKNGRKLLDYLSDYPPNYQRMAIGLHPVIHHKKPITKENIDDYIRRSDIGLTDFEIVMCDGNYKQALEMLLTKIEKAPPVIPKSAWIPVTERLPEYQGAYLVTVKDELHEGLLHAMVCNYIPTNVVFRWSRLDIHGPVVAWMPLPKSYESEEKKE